MAEIGRIVGGRYRLVELLGEVVYATVFRAHDTQLNRDVEVKLLRPEYAHNLDFLSELRWQARAASSLDHDNIAAVYDFGTDDAGTYLVTEFVDGADLASLLERNGPVPPRRAARAAAEVAHALAAAHERGLAHGDVQPANVMVASDGHVKLAGFGVARAFAAVADAESANIKRSAGDSAGPAGRHVGVPSEASDVDGLGLLLYELLTGRGPWVGDSAEEVAAARRAGPPAPPSTLNPAVPTALDEIPLRALGAAPGKRYESAMAVATALESFLGESPAAASATRRAAGVAPAFAAATVAAATAAAATAPAGRAYSADAYASMGGSADAYEHKSDASGYSPEAEPRRPVRRLQASDPEPLEESPGSSRWAWVAGILAILVIVIIGLIVWLVFSKGPQSTVLAPNLVSRSFTQAQQDVDRVGLKLTFTSRPNDTNQPDNTVVDQKPPANTPMRQGDTIAVVVLSGQATVVVPNLVGLSENAARNQLTSVGLQAGVRDDQNDPSTPVGQIVSTNPRAGIPVQRGSTVDYTISKGPAPTPTPTPSPSPSPTPTPTPSPTPSPTAAPTTTPIPSASARKRVVAKACPPAAS